MSQNKAIPERVTPFPALSSFFSNCPFLCFPFFPHEPNQLPCNNIDKQETHPRHICNFSARLPSRPRHFTSTICQQGPQPNNIDSRPVHPAKTSIAKQECKPASFTCQTHDQLVQLHAVSRQDTHITDPQAHSETEEPERVRKGLFWGPVGLNFQ
jgi:hypothetical protein